MSGHAPAYATADWNRRTRHLATAVLVTTALYGVGIEFGQSLVPARQVSVADAYANAFGALLVAPWYAVRPYVNVVSLRSWLGELSE